MESAEMISRGTRAARRRAVRVLPLAVGPTRKTTGRFGDFNGRFLRKLAGGVRELLQLLGDELLLLKREFGI